MSDTGNNHFRVFLDTNVLISAVVWPNSEARKCLNCLMDCHHILLSEDAIHEVFNVLKREFPRALPAWDRLFTRMDFELIYTPQEIDFPVPHIRDEKDKPILASAILAQPDILISGDKDVHTDEIKEYLAVYTPGDFVRDFCRNIIRTR